MFKCTRALFLASLLGLICLTSIAYPKPGESESIDVSLTSICIITENVTELVEFYTGVLAFNPQKNSKTYAEFQTDKGILAIFRIDRHEEIAPNSAELIKKGNTIIEFQVQDVDKEFERLKMLDIEWIKEPTTQPWGTRSIYFRDPDGNMVNFYTRLK